MVNRAYWDFAAKDGVMILESINGGYATIESNGGQQGFYRSTDNGASWTQAVSGAVSGQVTQR